MGFVCSTMACLQMMYGPAFVHRAGQYIVLRTPTHFHYCRKQSPNYSCSSVSIDTSQDSSAGNDGSSRRQILDLRWE